MFRSVFCLDNVWRDHSEKEEQVAPSVVSAGNLQGRAFLIPSFHVVGNRVLLLELRKVHSIRTITCSSIPMPHLTYYFFVFPVFPRQSLKFPVSVIFDRIKRIPIEGSLLPWTVLPIIPLRGNLPEEIIWMYLPISKHHYCKKNHISYQSTKGCS